MMCQRVEIKEIYKAISLDYPDKVMIKHVAQERRDILSCEMQSNGLRRLIQAKKESIRDVEAEIKGEFPEPGQQCGEWRVTKLQSHRH